MPIMEGLSFQTSAIVFRMIFHTFELSMRILYSTPYKKLWMLFLSLAMLMPFAEGQAIFKAIKKAKVKKVTHWIKQDAGSHKNLFISIAQGADTGKLDPLSYAIYCKKNNIATLIIDHKDSFEDFASWANTALGVAVAQNDTTLCNKLIALGANTNGAYALRTNNYNLVTFALLQNQLPMAKLLVQNNANPLRISGTIAPIHAAVFAQNLEALSWLVNEKGASPEQLCSRGYSALWYAILQEKMPLITFFEEKKIEFNHRSPEMETYYHAALATQNMEVIQWVKARVNLPETVSPNPMSPIVHLLIAYGDLELFNEAIQAGMEVYDMDKFSRTAPFALLNATRNRKKFAEILLVDYQLDPNLTDAYGKTVKQYATEKNDKELLKILNSINTPK